MPSLSELGIVFLTVICMEGFAWWMHKYILHGPLWFLHRSHHRPRSSWWELNDIVSLVYGMLAAISIVYGIMTDHWIQFWGWGITLYGILYFTFHDVIIHRRIKVRYKFSNKYVNRLIRAHKIHHKHLQKEGSEAFGFLYASKKYQP